MIQLETPGIYLFGPTTKVQCVLEQQTAVVLYIAPKQSCGIALLSLDSKVSETKQLLANLVEKIKKDLRIDDPRIEAKVFGGARGGRMTLQTAVHWLKANGLNIKVQETGGGQTRKMVVECSTGRVGISYAEPTLEAPFLTLGTARLRNPGGMIHTEILVLTGSPVKRALSKQAVEENDHWLAFAPKNPTEFLKGKQPFEFRWSVALLFDDLDESLCEKWIETVHAKFPAVQFRWVGAKPPTFARLGSILRHLPPLEPLLIPEFKDKLSRAVVQHATSETNDLIPFPAKRVR